MNDKLLKPVNSCKTEQSIHLVNKRKWLRLVYKIIVVVFILYDIVSMWLNYE